VRALLFSYTACLLSVVCFGGWRQHKLVAGFLLHAVASAAFIPSRPDNSFCLSDWYPALLAGVAIFRLLAGLEVLHRQTYPFPFWGRLNGSAWFMAASFAGVCWLMRSDSAIPGLQGQIVDARRLSQIWMAGVFIAVEGMWIGLRAGLWRRADLVAVAWGIMALNHALSSILGFAGRWKDWARWWDGQGWTWGIDAAIFAGLALLFSGFRAWPVLIRVGDVGLRAWRKVSGLRG